MTHTSLLSPPLLFALAGLAACTAELPDVTTSEQSICGLGCGENGGVIAGVPFWELHLGGLANAQGVRLKGFAEDLAHAANKSYSPLYVDGARLRGKSSVGVTLLNQALKNTIMVLGVKPVDKRNETEVYLKITDVSLTSEFQHYWTSGIAAGGTIETYRFQWAIPDPANPTGHLPFVDMCPNLTAPGEPWTNTVHAIVFEGDRYTATREIQLSPHGGWFNIACAGGTPAKMHLVRRTSASSSAGISTTIADDRQAFARMWAADYCGDGHSFTETGHKLRIRDRKGWIAAAGPVGYSTLDSWKLGFTYEAVWRADGAVCLNTPRLADVNPGIKAEIDDRCSIPSCSSQPWFPANWKLHGDILSANPAPSPVIVPP
ncbi:MAG: ADYC domain-containing protein [Kofleriaceae bacterium]